MFIEAGSTRKEVYEVLHYNSSYKACFAEMFWNLIDRNDKESHVQQAATSNCPFATVDNNSLVNDEMKCPFHKHFIPDEYSLTKLIDLRLDHGSHRTSVATTQLLHDIGGADRIRELSTRFYARAFLDFTLKPFFFAEDGAVQHGKRLADWIIEQMSVDEQPWTESGRFGLRAAVHYRAWNNYKRSPQERGKRFKLDDCRVWMRLNFWAARECQLDKHEVFFDWYIQFIEHFIRVYEQKAPKYAADDAAWSLNPENIAAYIGNNHKMVDVIGVGRS